jgi:hypothetical protein
MRSRQYLIQVCLLEACATPAQSGESWLQSYSAGVACGATLEGAEAEPCNITAEITP